MRYSFSCIALSFRYFMNRNSLEAFGLIGFPGYSPVFLYSIRANRNCSVLKNGSSEA